MSTFFHPLAELDRVLTNSQGDLMMGTPLSKYQNVCFSTASSDTLFDFLKDSHKVFIGPWDDRRDELIHRILIGVMTYSGSISRPIPPRLSHLNFLNSFMLPVLESEGSRPKPNMHPFSALAIHEYMHAVMNPFAQGKKVENPPTPEGLHPQQPQLEIFHLHAKEVVSTISEKASRDTTLLKELIQANEEESYLSPNELLSYLLACGVTEDQFLMYSSSKVKRDYLEVGMDL